VWSDIRIYRPYHLKHHAATWTAEDPDLGLASPFPITRESFRGRSGGTSTAAPGVKRFRTILRFHRIGANFDAGREVMGGVLLTNGVPARDTGARGPSRAVPPLGRRMAHHVQPGDAHPIDRRARHDPDPGDDFRNTRTTLARWWSASSSRRIASTTHLEHHLMVAVPHYNLPRLHRMLRERGVLAGACVAPGYLSVLRLAASR
jgi:fatty acid desaturase